MRVLVCGSRNWADRDKIRNRLVGLPKGSSLIHGGARGADTLAENIALELGITTTIYLPDWNKYGKRAGLLRNVEMLDSKPDLVIAFWNGKSSGTAFTIREARNRNIPVEIYQEEESDD